MKTQPESDSKFEDELAKEFANLGLNSESFEDDIDSPEVDRKLP